MEGREGDGKEERGREEREHTLEIRLEIHRIQKCSATVLIPRISGLC